MRGGCATAGGCSAGRTGAGSLGLVCGAGECLIGGFSSTSGGAGWGGGCGGGCACGCDCACDCASSEAFVLLLRGTGTMLGSLGSDLRGFRVFFSGSRAVGSLAFGFGPGFFRGWPLAVRPRACVAGDAFAGVGVLVPTPTPPADARTVDVGVPCSGECGGELRLPGEDAPSTSMARHRQEDAARENKKTRARRGAGRVEGFRGLGGGKRLCRAEERGAARRGERPVVLAGWLAGCAGGGCADSTPKKCQRRMGARAGANTKGGMQANGGPG